MSPVAPVFARTDEGVRVTLDEQHALLLRRVPDDVLGVLDEPAEGVDELQRRGRGADPARARLFPRAYLDPTEEQAEDDWQRMVHPELLAAKRSAARTMAATLERARSERGRVVVELDGSEAEAWLGVLNDLRLVLGTRLGIEEDVDLDALDPEDPDGAGRLFYVFLTAVAGGLVEALLD